jgi:hypothetical protein
MAELTRAHAAAEALLLHKEALAQAITVSLYGERPELLVRYGERGRVKCLEDMRYNLEHLAPAVALGEPSMFGRYVTWLAGMLAARDIPVGEVRRSLELTRAAVEAQLLEDEAALVAAAVSAGLAALDGQTAA